MGQSNCKILDCTAGCCNKEGICPIQPFSLGASDRCAHYYTRTLAIYIAIPFAFVAFFLLIIALCCYFRARLKTSSNCDHNSSENSSKKNLDRDSQQTQKLEDKPREMFHVQRRDSSNELIYDQGVISVESAHHLNAGLEQDSKNNDKNKTQAGQQKVN